MNSSADLGGCYPPRPSASVDNTLLDLQNSSYLTQPHSKIAKYISELAKKNTRFAFQYTEYNRRYTGRYLEGVYTEFYSCGRILVLYVSTHFNTHHVYCVNRKRILVGTWKAGVYTKFYSCGRVPSSSGRATYQYTCMQYSLYTGRIKGYTECGVEGMCTNFVYFVNIAPWF